MTNHPHPAHPGNGNPATPHPTGGLYRREKLESQHGVKFTLAPPEDDTTPRYPLRWTAEWTAPDGSSRHAGPGTMEELIPAIEGELGTRQ
jgi:hypothetical protein